MNKNNIISTFVKDPRQVPIKTRLNLPQKLKEDLFKASALSCMTEYLALSQVNTNWSFKWHTIAENESSMFWPIDSANCIFQTIHRPGELGKSLEKEYKVCKRDFTNVVFIGGDCPLISREIFQKTYALLEEHQFVLGPATDGGFYLFAGNIELPEGIWASVDYSKKTTKEDLKVKLKSYGSVAELDVLDDFDEVKDLSNVFKKLQNKDRLNVHQEKFKVLLSEYLKDS